MPLTIKSLSRSGKASSRKRAHLLQNVLLERILRPSPQVLLSLSLLVTGIGLLAALYLEDALLGELGKAFSILFLLNVLRLMKGPTSTNKNH